MFFSNLNLQQGQQAVFDQQCAKTVADSALLKYYMTDEQYVDVPVLNTLQESASSIPACKKWAEMVYSPMSAGKGEHTAQVTTKLMLLLARILSCQENNAESVYADIIMQLEYARVEGQHSIADQRITQNAKPSSAPKRVITQEELEMSQIDLDETSGELLKTPGGGYKGQLASAEEHTLDVRDLQRTQEPEESSSQNAEPAQPAGEAALPCKKEDIDAFIEKIDSLKLDFQHIVQGKITQGDSEDPEIPR